MKRLTDIDFTYRKYRNQEELKKAIKNGDVDIYLDYFNYSDNKFLATNSTFIEKYVVLKKIRSNEVVDSFESLKGKTISMLNNNSIYNYFNDNARVNIEESNNLTKLLSKAKDNLVVLDNEVYNYYKNTKLASYEVVYTNYMTNDYKFMVKSDNKTFYDLFNYIITTNSYYKYRNTGIINMKTSILDRKTFEETYLIVLALVFTPLFLIVISYFIIKNRRKIKLMRKEDRKRYTDMLTSLKNRNYLKLKIKEWDSSKVYPQSIIIIDLNNVKYVNTNYGHEKGDDLIVKAASILVNNQLENSEIIRTDGNEFLIYLVGYSENQISTYGKKLSKELKELPYGFGAALGYSMITDDIKTIDDAICEATLEMRTDKESYK
jgi:diguanylate cyclase (GGDEF)-like protein